MFKLSCTNCYNTGRCYAALMVLVDDYTGCREVHKQRRYSGLVVLTGLLGKDYLGQVGSWKGEQNFLDWTESCCCYLKVLISLYIGSEGLELISLLVLHLVILRKLTHRV